MTIVNDTTVLVISKYYHFWFKIYNLLSTAVYAFILSYDIVLDP